MKKRGMIRVAVWILLLVTLLSSCGKKSGDATFICEDGKFRNKQSGVTYSVAPFTYRATSYSEDERIGTYRDSKGTETCFYAVTGLNGCLTDDDYLLYCADGFTLPSLSQMQVAQIDLCPSEVYLYSERTIRDEATVLAVVSACEGGAELPYAKIYNPASGRYDLVFAPSDSSVYAGICRSLEYLTYEKDVLVYAELTADGQIPADLYPGIPATAEDGTAIFNFGKQLVYDRYAGVCYAVQDLFG